MPRLVLVNMTRQKKILVRSASDGQLTTRPLCPRHRPTPHQKTNLLSTTPLPDPNYRSCDDSDCPNRKEGSRNYGSYWSPVISEIDYHFPPLNASRLNRRVKLHRLIFLLIQTSLVITHTTSLATTDKALACLLLLAFHLSACLSALFSPILCTYMSENTILLSGSISACLYGLVRLVTGPVWLCLLPAAVVSGWSSGLLMVQAGVGSLNLGLQYSRVKSLKDDKGTAGDWYLRTGVLVQAGGLVGSMLWSGVVVYLRRTASSWMAHVGNELTIGRQCGKGICPPLKGILPERSNWTIRAEREMARQAAVIDEAWLLSLIAGAAALTASLFACLAFCLSKLAGHSRRPGSRMHGNNRVDEDELSVSETTQIYSESPVRQLCNILRLFLYDHKLQTVLPLYFFTGFQNAFIETTFAKNFTACALGELYIGFTSATHSGVLALTLWIVYKFSRHSKRLYVLHWIVLFQAGIGAVVIVWLPANHDVPMFFIVAAVFGVVEGGLTALISGVLVRMFAHDWTGTYSIMVAFKFVGFCVGACSSIFLCTVAQMYMLYAVFILALIPYYLLEWKYNSFLHRKSFAGEHFV